MLLSIFTPTYNRRNKLEQLYRSLKNQIDDECEWIIVDDGSTDATEKVILQFCNESVCNIRYIKKENGGKHTAHNLAVDIAKGDYFMCLDSDDFLQDQAIIKLLKFINTCENNEGIIAYKCEQSGKLLSDEFPLVDRIDNIYMLEKKYECRGEFTFVFPTHILRNNKFPVYSGEKFITESVLYDRLELRMKLFPEIMEVCEYQEEGLSNNLNKIMKKNPAGYCLYFMQKIDMQNNLKKRIEMIGKYLSFCLLSGKKKTVYKGKYTSLVICCYPIGIIFWIYYKLVRKL